MKSPSVLVLACAALFIKLAAAADDVVVVTDTAEAQATVVAIEKSQRRLVLRDDKANEYEILAGPEVRNFNEIKKGDVVELRYQRAAASRLEKLAGPDAAAEMTRVERAPAGAKPEMTAIRSRTIAAKVIEIDTQHRLLTVQGPKGNVVTVRVPPGLLAFDKLEIGDTIAAGYTEAIAISVRTPARKK
ncbi:MAG TPA: hypothetical protein DIC36_06115 [Gammaproteobacteria bacterium]|nr:hypothetical protein [Gammaproteobacteria bacterium]